MTLGRARIRYLIDLGGAVVMCGIVVSSYLLIFNPIATRHREIPELRAQVTEITNSHEQLTLVLRDLEQRIRAVEGKLKSQREDQPLSDSDLTSLVSRFSALEGLTILSIAPGAGAAEDGLDLRVETAGPFADCTRAISRLEAASPYLEIRALSINGPAKPGEHQCQCNWTIRMKQLADAPTPERSSG